MSWWAFPPSGRSIRFTAVSRATKRRHYGAARHIEPYRSAPAADWFTPPGFMLCPLFPGTVRFWWNRFGPMFAAEIRRRRAERLRAWPQWQWHLDEVFVRINGVTHYLWRAVDHEGEVLEAYVTKRRDRHAALKFLRKAMKRYGQPEIVVTDRLRSYKAAMREIGNEARQETGRWLNNRAENSHLPFRRRERAMLRFRRMRSLQTFAAVHSSVHNHFNLERHLYSRENFKENRAAALAEWRQLAA